MSFRLFAAVLTIALAGCARETVPQKPAQSMQGANTGCLTGFQDRLRDYLDGKSDEKTIHDLFNCADGAIKLFSEQVHGEKRNEYKPGELSKFLQAFYIKGEDKIPQDLVDAFVVFHATIVGSSQQALT